MSTTAILTLPLTPLTVTVTFGGLLPFGRDRQMGLGWMVQAGPVTRSMPTASVVKVVLAKVLWRLSPQTVRTLAM